MKILNTNIALESQYIRITLQACIIVIYKVIYIILAFAMGFGSSGNHLWQDILLNIILCSLCCFTYYALLQSFNIFKKTEMTIVMVITIIAWVMLYYYYR